MFLTSSRVAVSRLRGNLAVVAVVSNVRHRRKQSLEIRWLDLFCHTCHIKGLEHLSKSDRAFLGTVLESLNPSIYNPTLAERL